METIGFANKFYTLWDIWEEPIYFTDAYGNHHLTDTKVHNCYIKNISFDKEAAFALYPDAKFDEELRGKSSSWDFNKKEEDTCPNILKFGKYSGHDVAEIVKTDFDYILWLIDNCYTNATKDAVMALPEVIQYFAEKETERKRIQDLLPVLESGEVEITFLDNPNRNESENGIIGELCTYKYPETLTWEECTDNKPDSDWKILLQAKSLLDPDTRYRINRYRDSENVCLNGRGDEKINTIEDAKQAAELLELEIKFPYDFNRFAYAVPSELTPLKDKFYSRATIGEGSNIYVFFPQIKSVEGMYPYNMAIINGKAQKVKGKKMKLNLKVLHTKKYDISVFQIAVVNEMSNSK